MTLVRTLNMFEERVTVDCECGRTHKKLHIYYTPILPSGKIGVYYICPSSLEKYVVAEIDEK